MTFRQPTFAGGLCTTTNDLRLMQAGIVCTEGVGGFDQMLVSATDPVSGAVQVSGGHLFVENDNGAGAGGMYHVFNDDAVELDVPLNSSGVDRTDAVWARVCDTEYGGVSGAEPIYDDDNPTLTPPADGCTYYLLASLVVPDGAGDGGTDISGTPTTWGDTDGMVTDERQAYGLCGAGGLRAIVTLDSGTGIDLLTLYPWVKTVKARGVGGGGGGGGAGTAGATNAPTVGAGGGAGAYFEKAFAVGDIPAGVVPYTIGAGGAGGTAAPGADGGNTTFLACDAGGGSGGGAASAASNTDQRATGGDGGSAGGGDLNIPGAHGGDAITIVKSNTDVPATTMRAWGGEGAGSAFGGGTGTFARTGTDWNGIDGLAPGAGGQGSYELADGGTGTGGDGADGVLILELYG